MRREGIDAVGDIERLPGMVLLGIGAGIAFNPMLLGAMSDVAPQESGLASGMLNTAFMMGGALGLAVLASFAAMRTQALADGGASAAAALNGGYRLAFVLGACCAAFAALLGGVFMRTRHADVLAAIRSTGKLEDDTRRKLAAALDEFAKVFVPTRRAGTQAA